MNRSTLDAITQFVDNASKGNDRSVKNLETCATDAILTRIQFCDLTIS